MTCQCGFENATDARFCLSCGLPLGGAGGVTVQRAAPAPKTGIQRAAPWLAGAVAVVAVILYQFVFKHDPERDGKRVALTFCSCVETFNAAVLTADAEFLKGFDAFKFVRQRDAQVKIQEIAQSLVDAQGVCSAKAATEQTDLRQRYVTNAQTLQQFDFAFQAQNSLCNPSNKTAATEASINVQRRIAAINDPEPTVDQIKADLIGKQVPGWNFDSLVEYTGVETTNVSRAGNRVEYSLKLHLHDAPTNGDHDLEAIVSYLRGDQGWAFANVRELSITYDNLVQSNDWTSVTPPQNCSWTASGDKRLVWKAYSSGPEVKSGPDVSAPFQLGAAGASLLVKSREGMPVVVRFTYRPN